MPFTVSDFPDRVFETYVEFEQALLEKHKKGYAFNSQKENLDEAVRVTATALPLSQDLVNQRIIELENKIDQLNGLINMLRLERINENPDKNKDGIKVGTVLRGESKGRDHTLQALSEGYLCSDGVTYETLSAAALGVSGNRRSGWKFWTDIEGKPVGEITGRFDSNVKSNPFATG